MPGGGWRKSRGGFETYLHKGGGALKPLSDIKGGLKQTSRISGDRFQQQSIIRIMIRIKGN